MGDDAKRDLIFVIFMLFALAVVWYYTGGPARPSATSGPFLEEPLEGHREQLRRETGRAAGEEPIEEPATEEPTRESAYKYKATLRADSAAKKTNPQEEYVEIQASSNNKEPLFISSWSLEGVKGLEIKLGQGAYLPYAAQVNPQENIFLKPGEKAYIITGKSPIGASFRLNKCTGYFEQFQDFAPRLPEQCPYPDEETLPSGLSDACLDYIERMPRCEIDISIPWYLDAACQNYINGNVNYNKCVELRRNDADFYKGEWRIYLGRSEELWKNKTETVILYDEIKKIIDWDSY